MIRPESGWGVFQKTVYGLTLLERTAGGEGDAVKILDRHAAAWRQSAGPGDRVSPREFRLLPKRINMSFIAAPLTEEELAVWEREMAEERKNA